MYALGWPLLDSSCNGFHEVAFAVPFTLLTLERGLAHRYGAAALWAALLCTAKEDMGLVVGAYGLVLAVRAHRPGPDSTPVREAVPEDVGVNLLLR
ncbi:hypothetical protein ACFYUJ_04270 [Streptomyces sp. NPDC004520]|uniref:hypothetical protein n=1 Tax=Streptomyces sp. NPDC004520 TaxID=3364702 RepID=UPI0036A1C0DF